MRDLYTKNSFSFLSFFLSFFIHSTCALIQNKGYYPRNMHQLHAMQGAIVRDKGTRILLRAQLKDERQDELQDNRWNLKQHTHSRLLTRFKMQNSGQTDQPNTFDTHLAHSRHEIDTTSTHEL